MKQGSRLLLVVLSTLVWTSAGATPPKYTIHWMLGHRNLDYFEEAAQNFKTAVEKRSRGEIAVEISTVKDDGTEAPTESAEIPQKVERGEAEMGHSFVDVMSPMEPRLQAFEAPYLFRNYRHMEAVVDGPVGRELLTGLEKHHMVGLSFTYSGGACGVSTTGKELRSPEDLRGLKVGVYGDDVDTAWLTDLGATPVPIAHRLEKILPLSSEGKLDAVVTTWRNFARTGLQARFTRMSLEDSSYLVSVTYVNDKFFASLPEKYRALLVEESRKAGKVERAKTIQLNEDSKRWMAGKGVKPVYLTAAGKAAFGKALEASYRGAIEAALGADLIKKIKDTADAPAQPSISGDLARR